ncbi:hypothetical protein KFL_003000160 [Klebsormidium nitens]|uniref:F-box domain-containing protein n=1 Tax=Klebsormidium nitens TaxID=105231 RepID=A0A1Y1I7W5_KLENI|nr:hypothetical protein KFL_003000160 [Klebsormidium nitens]|eukprot:GAQ86623.1 hypothetical protein KFL_003000160 [Klebsormidium nitens]
MMEQLIASAMDVGQAGLSLDEEGAGSFPIHELPADVVRIILKMIAFRDRLALEMVSKGHRDVLRDLEPWHAVNLRVMSATDVSESQFVKVLAQIQPGFDKALPQIESMAAVFDSFAQAHRERRQRPWSPIYKDVYLEARIASIVRAAGFPYQQKFLEKHLERSLSSSKRVLEACTILAAENVDWLKEMGRKVSEVVFPPFIETAAAQIESSMRERVCVWLNVSGAKMLSPSFLAASVIVLSAAGYRVDLRMNRVDDPPFPMHHTDILRALTGGDCTFRVNLAISDTWSAFRYGLDDLTVPSEGPVVAEQRRAFQSPLARVLANASSLTYSEYSLMSHDPHEKHSKALYNNFLSKVLTIAHLKNAAGNVLGCWEQTYHLKDESKVVTEMLVTKRGSEIAEFLRRRPELCLRLLDCDRFSSDPLSTVCEAIGGSGVFHVSFQAPKVDFWGHDWREDIFGSVALQTSAALQVLEVDFRLSPQNFDSIAHFLSQNQHGAQVCIHLRASFYRGRQQEAKAVLAKLAEMRLSEWGSRLTIVQHRAGLLGAVESEGGSSETGLSLAPIQQLLASARRGELLAKGLEWINFLARLLLAIGFSLYTLLEPSAFRRLLGMGDVTGKAGQKIPSGRIPSGILLYSCLTFVPWWVAWFLFKIFILYVLLCFAIKRLPKWSRREMKSLKAVTVTEDPFFAAVEDARSVFNSTGRTPSPNYIWLGGIYHDLETGKEE